MRDVCAKLGAPALALTALFAAPPPPAESTSPKMSANQPPFFRFTTLRQATLTHAGEALAARQAFEALDKAGQDAVIEFLKTLQVLPPGTKDRIVDENFKPKQWPPRRGSAAVPDDAAHF